MEIVKSPLMGEIIALEQVEDQAFAKGMLGEGIAINPLIGKLYAPVDGKISAILPTKHAIGITSDSGIEILVHIGFDTVELNGKPYISYIKQGEIVKQGQLLLEFDIKQIQDSNRSVITPIVITNADEYIIKIISTGNIEMGETILEVYNK